MLFLGEITELMYLLAVKAIVYIIYGGMVLAGAAGKTLEED
jgi:hypothetical protein